MTDNEPGTLVDERDLPIWRRYLVLVNDDHDKFYEVCIDIEDNGMFTVVKHWGRNPDLGHASGARQVVTSTSSGARAASVANDIIKQKIGRGYSEIIL